MKHHSVHEIAHEGVHHARKARKAGGMVESPKKGVDEAEMDLRDKPTKRVNAPAINDEAEKEGERKRGGRAKRKHGGVAEKKHVGHVAGEEAHKHAGRKPRKAGGRAGSDVNPFTSAHHGTPARGRTVEKMTEGSDV